ncbi:MAG: hypothetical protein HYU33_05165 [Candidatus Omnitrophica bacterium]|nr:hypothetical protein [Candidatus Omnitrophota bacterium]
MKTLVYAIGAGVVMLCGAPTVIALEERVQDLSASVEIAEVFSLSLGNPNLVFPLITPGTTAVLGEGGSFDEIQCRSNTGRPWYLTAHVVSLKHLDRTYSLPPSYLKWKMVGTTGQNKPATGQMDFASFSDQPVLLYAGVGDDARGKEVLLSIQYGLSIPPEAPAGNYGGQILFTMTEAL